ncbi:MAG: hypothetical protein IKZ61_12285 [Prevotella sp.]|nr:hypothetical protein [Prevotella sp.]
MKEFLNSEHFFLIITGIASIAYACSWIRKILKSPKPYQRRQYLYIALALLMIILGISTFFTKFTLNYLCGVYAGVSEFIILHYKYLEDRKKNIPWHDGIIYYTSGIGIGLTFILFSLHSILKMNLD